MSDEARGRRDAPPVWQPDPLLLPRGNTRRFQPEALLLSGVKPFDAVGPIVLPDDVAPAEDPALAEAEAAPEPEPEAPEPPPVIQGYSEAELEAARRRAYDEGLREGRRQGEQAIADDVARLRALAGDLAGFLDDPGHLLQPVERLAVHLAEQLVRAELSLSDRAITALVEHALQTLEQAGFGMAVIQLNPEDLALLQRRGLELPAGVQLESDTLLSRGSLRVSAQDTVLTDFIEHRLAALADTLLALPSEAGAGSRSPGGDGGASR